MAEGIVYLDVDDEITSAASRIRSSASPRVALVVPYGSRIATSRMNFRLLSREALVSNRRLSIVSGDAASRALAASAGLPVFASIAELEGAEPGDREGSLHREEPGDREEPRDGGGRGASAVAGTLAASETVAGVGPSDVADASAVARPRDRPARAARGVTDDTIAMPLPLVLPDAVAAGADIGGRAGATRRPNRVARQPIPPPPVARDLDELDDEPREARRVRTPLLVALALVALAVLVGAVAAFVLLPAATIAVIPKPEPISVELTVTADPAATAVDPANATVPAMQIHVPVEASQTFTTTGVHVDQAPATGEVTFSNYNFLNANNVPAGSAVSTEGGIRFKTLAAITIPPGTFVLPNVVPAKRTVKVQAVKPGPEGNVPANAIRVVPQGENPDFLKVTNDQPTTGGVRTQTPEVSQAEVDKAMATLRTQLDKAFADAVSSGAGAPAGATIFPRTAALGDVTPSVDPKTLVGQAIESYDLTLAANGTVIAVDPSPIRALAASQLDSKVGSDHKLVADSVTVDVGEGTVDETGAVTFDATAHGLRIATLDPATLRSLVKGKTASEAKAALARYGDVRVDIWPSWASTVTSIDARLNVTVDESAASAGAASPQPSTGPAPTRRPTPSIASGAAGSSPESAAP
jgi:Baseplate J-like protein